MLRGNNNLYVIVLDVYVLSDCDVFVSVIVSVCVCAHKLTLKYLVPFNANPVVYILLDVRG